MIACNRDIGDLTQLDGGRDCLRAGTGVTDAGVASVLGVLALGLVFARRRRRNQRALSRGLQAAP